MQGFQQCGIYPLSKEVVKEKLKTREPKVRIEIDDVDRTATSSQLFKSIQDMITNGEQLIEVQVETEEIQEIHEEEQEQQEQEQKQHDEEEEEEEYEEDEEAWWDGLEEQQK